MTKNTPRLELTWIGKENRPRLEPRILIEEPDKSYHAPHRVTENDLYDNKLIFGDNLLALKALEADYAGQVKCIYIDPPYNTGSAFTHYDDGLEHSIWLSMMRDRLEILRKLLREDGSIWVNIDDNEAHYLKVLMDEVFGRTNFVANVIWQKKYAVSNDHKTIAPMHDHLLVFRRSDRWQRNLFPRTMEKNRQYRFEDEGGVFRISDYTCNKSSDERPNLYYPIVNPHTGTEVYPSKTRVWAYSQDQHRLNEREGLVYWGKDGESKKPSFKRYLHTLKQQGVVPHSIWTHEFAGHTDIARKEVRSVLGSQSLQDDFITPKPESLIYRVLQIATNPGDLVLDSFAGSGTTGAVAHKMGRRWIMIELGEHCHTHIIPRLRKVIDGTDQGGISRDVNWKGGGGFRYYRLAPSLLEKDKWGRWVISKQYDPTHLAEAVCKHAGFRYAPDPDVPWIHGQSTETDFIYVTTQQLQRGKLEVLSDEVGPDRTLMVFCAAFEGKENDFPNLTVKKIPASLLKKCEWGKDDYSLQVANLPMAPQLEDDQLTLFEEGPEYGSGNKASSAKVIMEDDDPDLFDPPSPRLRRAGDEIEESPPPKKRAAKRANKSQSSKGRGGKK